MDFRGKRVTVMGLGHFGGGVSASRWLARQGAMVTVTDLADQTVLADSIGELEGEPIAEFHLGGHLEADFREADLVVVNPAVRPGNPFVEMAAGAGVARTTEIELFLHQCAGRIVGVTGTNGKSTTAAMTASILRAARGRTWLGGNIGRSLLDQLEEITEDDWIVLEMSSFQLWRLGRAVRLPDVAVVTGCSPNHRDWHGNYEHYVAAKQRILAPQQSDQLAVLNTLDLEVASWSRLVRDRQLPLAPVTQTLELSVPGEHNRMNARLASTAARAAGCDERAIQEGLRSFRGLPGRLEMVAVIAGRRFYNDTMATTPESTVAALQCMPSATWLLAGGRDKGAGFGPMAETIVRHSQGAAFFGSVAARLVDEVRSRLPRFRSIAVKTMDEAIQWCWQTSRPGDSILLSPACSSLDQFKNCFERGKQFVRIIRQLSQRRNT